MPVTPRSLSVRLLEEGDRTANFYRTLPVEVFEHKVYSDGDCWKVKDILAHQVGAEISLRRLVENILAGGEGSPENFDLNAYNERKAAALRNLSTSELVEQFLDARKKTADLVGQVAESDLDKQGRHPFLGSAALLEIIKLIYRHNSIHIREIRRSISSAEGKVEDAS